MPANGVVLNPQPKTGLPDKATKPKI